MSFAICIYLIILSTFSLAPISIQKFQNLQTPGNLGFADEAGRWRQFRGLNAVFKQPPYYPSFSGPFNSNTSLNEQDAKIISDWGFNFVRLGYMWSGAEPTENLISESYLENMAQISKVLAEKEIFTLFDAHQDVLHPDFCGEGWPDWMIHKNASYPFPLPKYPPFKDNSKCFDHNFFTYYQSKDVAYSMQMLYENPSQMVNFWTKLAEKMNHDPHVLGYEIINEPWPGDTVQDPQLFTNPGLGDRKFLSKFYDVVANAIHKVSDQLVFYENGVLDIYHPAGFIKDAPASKGGILPVENNVFTFHCYSGITNSHGYPSNVTLAKINFDKQFYQRISDIQRYNVLGFMSEFGAMGDFPSSLEMIDHILDRNDQNLLSHSWWQYKLFDDITTLSTAESLYTPQGKLEIEKVKHLVRPWARAVAGVPSNQQFVNNVFSLTWKPKNLVLPTEIFMARQFWFKSSLNIQCPDICSCHEDGNLLLVFCSSSNQQVTLTISP